MWGFSRITAFNVRTDSTWVQATSSDKATRATSFDEVSLLLPAAHFAPCSQGQLLLVPAGYAGAESSDSALKTCCL